MDGLAPKMDGAQAGDRCPTTDASASSVSRRALSSFWREPKRTCMFEGMHRTVLVSLVFLGFSLQAVSVNFQKGDCRGVTKPGRVFSAEMCMKPLSKRPFSPHPLAHTTPLSAEFQTEPGAFFPEGARCASASMNLDEQKLLERLLQPSVAAASRFEGIQSGILEDGRSARKTKVQKQERQQPDWRQKQELSSLLAKDVRDMGREEKRRFVEELWSNLELTPHTLQTLAEDLQRRGYLPADQPRVVSLDALKRIPPLGSAPSCMSIRLKIRGATVKAHQSEGSPSQKCADFVHVMCRFSWMHVCMYIYIHAHAPQGPYRGACALFRCSS
ncbi:unnamed protein product [Effrenium voratum]|nr:unnamed protein product [Effrenium voratum]